MEDLLRYRSQLSQELLSVAQDRFSSAVGLVEIIDRGFCKARPYTPSSAALGIALTIPACTSFSMFLGAFIVWILERKAPKWNDACTIPIASGCIAGESIMGVILAAPMAFGVLN